MNTYFGYARISSRDQSKHSLEKQEEILLKQAERYPAHVFEFHKEEKSGLTQSGRPVFQAILRRAQRGDVLGVAYPDRLGRSLETFNTFQNLFERGVVLDIQGKIHDPSDPISSASDYFQVIISHLYSQIQGKKARDGIAIARQNGKYLYKDNIFGYRRLAKGDDTSDIEGEPVALRGDTDLIGIHSREAETIRMIYTALLAAQSYPTIATRLIEEGRIKAVNHVAGAARVRKIAMNPIYMGFCEPNPRKLNCKAVDRSQIVPSDLVKSAYYPAIVPEDLWWRVYHGRRLVASKHPTRAAFRTRDFEATGLVLCDHCVANGRRVALVRGLHQMDTKTTRSSHYPIYQSGLHLKGCPTIPKSFKAEVLENLLRCLLVLSFSDPSESRRFVLEELKKNTSSEEELTKRTKMIEANVAEINKQRERLADFVQNAGDDDGLLARRFSTLTTQRSDLISKLETLRMGINLNRQQVEQRSRAFSASKLNEFFAEEATPQKRRKILFSVIESARLVLEDQDRCYLVVKFWNGKAFRTKLERAKGKRYQQDFVTTVTYRDTFQGELLVEVGLGHDDFLAYPITDDGARGPVFPVISILSSEGGSAVQSFFDVGGKPLFPEAESDRFSNIPHDDRGGAVTPPEPFGAAERPAIQPLEEKLGKRRRVNKV